MSVWSAKNKITSNLGTLAIVAVFLAVWELLASYKLIDIFFFSKPSTVLMDLKKLFLTGEILPHIKITMQEALTGLAVGSIVGVIIAFIFGQIPIIARVFDPIIMALYGIPKLALGPLFIMWFGLGLQSKIFLATLMVFFLVFFNAYAGFKNVEPGLINAVKLMGGTKGQIIRKVVLPSCLPWIMAGLRGGIGSALLGAIVGEYLGSNSGLGWMVEYAGGMFDITRVISCIVVLMVIMAVMNTVLKLLEKRLLKWQPSIE